MTSTARKKMLERIKAMLNTEGRTEAEMMAFLAKARELMATYEVSEADIASLDQEAAKLHRTAEADPYDIKSSLCQAVAKFTRCKGWGGKISPISFVGLESDVIFATWLMETLQRFVMRELRSYQKKLISKGARHSNNLTSASFVTGCVMRIKEKLAELTVKMPAKNKEIIEAELARNGIKLTKYSTSHRAHAGSVLNGRAAGEHARFDRPVGQGGTRLLK